MQRIRHILIIFALGLLALGSQAAAVDINGVKVPDQVSVNATPLQLNGAGTRYKVRFPDPH